MVYTIAARLRFVLVSQFVGGHHRSFKKSRLSPKASLAAEEMLNVTHNHRATRERRMRKQRCSEKGQNERIGESPTESGKEDKG